MNEWRTLKDHDPQKECKASTDYVLISDHKRVWIESMYDTFFRKTYNPDFVWKEIDIPEVPKVPEKPDHYCENGNYRCIEMYGRLVVIKIGEVLDELCYKAKACPFCGYSIPKEGV